MFIRKMEELASEQMKQLEIAVINRGKLRLSKQYQSLQVLEDKWFRMSTSAQETHLKKFHRTLPSKDGLIPSEAPQSSVSGSCSALSVSVDVIAADSPVPHSVFNGIWIKASELVHLMEPW